MSKVLTIDLESFLCLWLGTCSSSALSSHPSARIRAKCQQTGDCLVWRSLAIVPTRRLFSVPVSDVWSWHNLSHNTIHWHCLITAAYESFLLLLSAPDPRGNSGQWGAAGIGGAVVVVVVDTGNRLGAAAVSGKAPSLSRLHNLAAVDCCAVNTWSRGGPA